jgi:hypothetical protein
MGHLCPAGAGPRGCFTVTQYLYTPWPTLDFIPERHSSTAHRVAHRILILGGGAFGGNQGVCPEGADASNVGDKHCGMLGSGQQHTQVFGNMVPSEKRRKGGNKSHSPVLLTHSARSHTSVCIQGTGTLPRIRKEGGVGTETKRKEKGKQTKRDDLNRLMLRGNHEMRV